MKIQDANSSKIIHCQGNRINSMLCASSQHLKPNIGFIIYTYR